MKLKRIFRVRVAQLCIGVLIIAATSFVGVSQSSGAKTPSPKPTAKKSQTVKKKAPAKKSTPKKRPRYKPLPTTPPKCLPKVPKNFVGVYISTPKGDKELICVLAQKETLTSTIQACQEKVCAVIYVASSTPCKWWEVQSIVVGKYADVLGNLQSNAKGSKAGELKTIILISKEPVEDYAEILNMKAFCRNDALPEKIPANIFTPNPELAPSPTPSTTAS
mgnify:CR=1 FL=1